MTSSAVELVSTGGELLSGRTLNRHAQLVGERLGALGLDLVRDTTVPDDAEAIREAVAGALRRVRVVLVTGGLGPTPDDLTRDVIAEMAGRAVVEDAATAAWLEKRLRQMGRRFTPQARRLARIVEGAEVLPNPVGAAPGQRVELDEGVVFLLPGPPDECRSVLEESVLPWLREHLAEARPRNRKLFLICGVGEADVQTMLESRGWPGSVEVTYRAAPARVELGLAAPVDERSALDAAAADVRRLLGAHIFAEERTELPAVVGDLLAEAGCTLATAESCTGGLVGHRITSIGGASRYYLGGVVAYANAVKEKELGVSAGVLESEGAVSEPVARAMAEGVRERFGADYGIGITGIAGPGGGTDEKPVGLVYIGIAAPGGSRVYRHVFPGQRGWIKEWSAMRSLDWLRRHLQGVESV